MILPPVTPSTSLTTNRDSSQAEQDAQNDYFD